MKIAEVEDEVALLQKESEMEIDDILNLLPAGYIDDYGGTATHSKAPSTSTVCAFRFYFWLPFMFFCKI